MTAAMITAAIAIFSKRKSMKSATSAIPIMIASRMKSAMVVSVLRSHVLAARRRVSAPVG
jgi:hypothetical protein